MTSDSPVSEVADDVIRVRAGNPGPMTLDGTNTWLVGAPGEEAVIIDPGPADPVHLWNVRRAVAVRGLDVRAVLLSHGHADHSEGAAELAAAVAAPLLAADPTFGAPLVDGDVIEVGALTVDVLATPGHTADSVSFAVGTRVFTGDTVLGRGTTVVAHPDGRLADYLASLERLRGHVDERATSVLLPGHGETLWEPSAVLDYYLTHRRERLAAVASAVAEIRGAAGIGSAGGSADEDLVAAVVAIVYADVPQHLWPAASLSVRAQLDYLAEQAQEGDGAERRG